MAIILSEEKKRQNYFTIVLGIVFLLVILIAVWRIFLSKPEKTLSPTIVKPPEIKINFEILKTPILKDLQPFEEIKPTEEPVGRENPFVPY